MQTLIPITLFGWVPVVIALFALLPPRRAALIGLLGGWLFLPVAGYSFEGLPNYDKTTAVVLGIALGVALFDAGSLRRLRPSWIDLPVTLWCAVPIASSLSNELGIYDGLSLSLTYLLTWGFPYAVGRLYFADSVGRRELVLGIALAGVVYMPLCIWEIRMSPGLHADLYGIEPIRFAMLDRYGGYRPIVFLNSPLAVGLWMAAATLCTFWLAFSGACRRIFDVPLAWVAPCLLLTLFLCKTRGALALTLIGLGAFIALRHLRARWVVIALVALATLYPIGRVSGALPAERVIGAMSLFFGEERLSSFGFRLDNEDILAEKAMRRPSVGWGAWGRYRVIDEQTGKDISVTDGLWIIALGRHGWVGLLALMGTFLVAPLLLALRMPARRWADPVGGPAAVLAVLAVLYFLDCLSNAMINLVVISGLGATAGSVLPRRVRRRRSAPVAPAQVPARQ